MGAVRQDPRESARRQPIPLSGDGGRTTGQGTLDRAPGTDDDGLFDDINGNGRIDFADAVRLSDRL
jgi:hypothetical protein